MPDTNTQAQTLKASSPIAKTGWKIWLLRSMAALGALLLGIYGLLAIDMGRVNISPVVGDAQQILAQRHEANSAADSAQLDNPALQQAWQHSGLWLYGMSKVMSNQHAYGQDSYFTYSMFHYAEMPEKNMLVLSFHNVMGGICMLFGALQFWPAFRKKYPRWHRGFGALYMVTAQLAMIAAMVYLSLTPVKTIYDSFSFYMGLWLLAIVVTVTLWLSIYHLKRGEYGQHQAYMAINFGALLTAPMLRYNWVLGGLLFPDVSFNTSNYWGAGILLPQCFILGYLLLCISRGLQKDRPQHLLKTIDTIPRWRYVLVSGLMASVLAAMLTTVYYVMLAPDIGLISQASSYIPAGLVQAYNQALMASDAVRLIFVVAMFAMGGLGILFLKAAFLHMQVQPKAQQVLAWGLVVSATILGVIQLLWAREMGPPTQTSLSAGTHAGLYGVLTLLFAGLLAYAASYKKTALIKEWGLLLVLISISLPVFFWILHGLMLLPIPQEFVLEGQVYRLAADAGPAFLLIGLFYAPYSQATLGKFAR